MELIYKIKSLTNSFLSLVFNEKCIGCEKKGKTICKTCIDNLKMTNKDIDNGIWALYDYRDPLVKKLIWNLKYYKYRYIGEILGEKLYNEFIEELSGIKILSIGQPIIIIPVPISKERRRKRGYNQSEVIVNGLKKNSPYNMFEVLDNIIIKKSNTVPQARINNKRLRLKNIKGTFILKNEEIIKNRIILIVDDVTTTGGTILEIKHLLEKAGAKKIIGLTVAH